MDDRAKTAFRSLDQAAASGESAVQDAQVHYVTALENASDLNMKLVEMVRANAEAATQIRAPADLVQAWSTHAPRQFIMLSEQSKELTAVWQRFFVPLG